MTPFEQVQYIANKIKEEPILNPPFEHSDNLIKDFTVRIDKFVSLLSKLSKHNNLTILDGIHNKLKTIESLKSGIIQSIKLHLGGNLHESYRRFERAINNTKVSDHISETAVPLTKIFDSFHNFYRVRVSDTPLTKREDLFHIPFNQRHIVKSQRFSISGLPCLYLGSSILVCWQEMGKPDFDKLYISAFSNENVIHDLKVIDLAFNLNSTLDFNLFDRLLDDEDVLELAKAKISNLMIWPLVLACSYKKKNAGSFNIEYVIPNLLMEWVSSSSSKDISGIAYRTTKFINKKNNIAGLNLIFPPKSDEMMDENVIFCSKLAESFKLTNPVAWQVMKTLAFQSNTPKAHGTSSFNCEKVDNLDEFLIDNYDKTEFSIIENDIKNLMEFNYVNNRRS